MQVKVFKNYNDLSEGAADLIISTLIKNPDAAICFASGDTPKGTYEAFCKKVKETKVDVSRMSVIALDEWVGITAGNSGSCRYFLNNYLIGPLGLKNENVQFFEGDARDLDEQCRQMDQRIQKCGGLDLMIVGIGMNAHIGFNEPGVPQNLYSHVVELEDITKSVGQKYFKETTELKYGLTIGLKHLLESKAVLLLANGERKSDIIKKTVEGPVDELTPSTTLRNHSNANVFIDEAAASKLTNRSTTFTV
jgi:glucosamine-6-phosphate isomerase